MKDFSMLKEKKPQIVVKPADVKIVQMTESNVVAQTPTGSLMTQIFIHGLGDDGLVYKWNGGKVQWEVQNN